MFLSFEGIDGCGKTTQIELLARQMQAAGHEVYLTREPGGTALAEAIREYLLHSQEALDARAELLLFGAARAAHVAHTIRPALARGEIVISDRFADSSLAYQGGALQLESTFVRTMNSFATGGLEPDITFLLDIEPETAIARRADKSDDRIEARGLEFQNRVREAFLEIARNARARICVLNGEQTREAIHQQVIDHLRERGIEL